MKKAIRKIAATTLSIFGILSAMPSAFCVPPKKIFGSLTAFHESVEALVHILLHFGGRFNIFLKKVSLKWVKSYTKVRPEPKKFLGKITS